MTTGPEHKVSLRVDSGTFLVRVTHLDASLPVVGQH